MEFQQAHEGVLLAYEEDKYLTTNLLSHASLEHYEYRSGGPKGRDVPWEHTRWFAPWVSIQRLIVLCNEFDQKIWGKWLRPYFIADEETSSHRGEVGNVELRMMATAGRLLLTLAQEDAYLTLITEDPDSQISWAKHKGWEEPRWKRLGVQGVGATIEQAEVIVRTLLDNSEALRESMHRAQNYPG